MFHCLIIRKDYINKGFILTDSHNCEVPKQRFPEMAEVELNDRNKAGHPGVLDKGKPNELIHHLQEVITF